MSNNQISSHMYVAKIPLRISFFGGGTDIPIYYSNRSYGCVINCTINRFIYISFKFHGELFDENYRLNYSKSEVANNLSSIENNIFREFLKFSKIKKKVYISTISDVPSSSGLGSSSALIVGLFMLLNKIENLKYTKKELIEQATQFEIKKISNSIGKQDHYSSFYGGLNFFKFLNDESVSIQKIKNSNFFIKNQKNFIFFWTGIQRNANEILKKQTNNFNKNFSILDELREITQDIHKKIKLNTCSFNYFAKKLDYTWFLKRKLTKQISDDFFDDCYNCCINNGAIGGKILGAGGGGFLMILAHKKFHKKIIFEMSKKGLKRESIDLYFKGPSLTSF